MLRYRERQFCFAEEVGPTFTHPVGRCLTRTSHKLAAATPDASVPTAFYSVALLDVQPKYACGGLPCKPYQNGASAASLRKLMRNSGKKLHDRPNRTSFSRKPSVNPDRLEVRVNFSPRNVPRLDSRFLGSISQRHLPNEKPGSREEPVN